MRSQKSFRMMSNAVAEGVGLVIRNGAKLGVCSIPLDKFLYKHRSHSVRIKQARFNLFKMGLKGVINLYRS